jgi:uncharacterized protein (TIGR04255 family)
MADREIYSNASVVLVALEVRHPSSEPSPDTLNALKAAVAPSFPLYRPAKLVSLTPAFEVEESTIAHRYFARDLTAAVTFRPGSIVVETTNYDRYESFRMWISLALRACADCSLIDGVERVGLRYIDEIRVPQLEAVDDWAEWLDPSLLCPLEVAKAAGLGVEGWQGTAAFFDGASTHLVLRHGPRHGHALDPTGDLRRSNVEPGPFYLLDIDSYWEAEGPIPELNPETVLATCDQIHAPVGGVFEGLITERLRQEVLRNGE